MTGLFDIGTSNDGSGAGALHACRPHDVIVAMAPQLLGDRAAHGFAHRSPPVPCAHRGSASATRASDRRRAPRAGGARTSASSWRCRASRTRSVSCASLTGAAAGAIAGSASAPARGRAPAASAALRSSRDDRRGTGRAIQCGTGARRPSTCGVGSAGWDARPGDRRGLAASCRPTSVRVGTWRGGRAARASVRPPRAA